MNASWPVLPFLLRADETGPSLCFLPCLCVGRGARRENTRMAVRAHPVSAEQITHSAVSTTHVYYRLLPSLGPWARSPGAAQLGPGSESQTGRSPCDRGVSTLTGGGPASTLLQVAEGSICVFCLWLLSSLRIRHTCHSERTGRLVPPAPRVLRNSVLFQKCA